MKQFAIEYTKGALEDLRSIYSYIVLVLQEPINANKLLTKIINGIDELEILPLRHPLVDRGPWKNIGVRKLIISGYIVLYQVEEKKNIISVVRIISSRQNLYKNNNVD